MPGTVLSGRYVRPSPRNTDLGGGNVPIVMSYQNITGALTPGAHPGSYNGQDAYNDMLVTDGNSMHGNRTGECGNHEGGMPYADE